MQPGAGIKFTIAGQEAEVDKIGMADLVAFERHFGVSAGKLTPDPLLDEDGNPVLDPETGEAVPDPSSVRLEWIAFLVWRSARRQGVIAKDVSFDDDFLEQIDGVDMETPEEVDQDVDPSTAAQPIS